MLRVSGPPCAIYLIHIFILISRPCSAFGHAAIVEQFGRLCAPRTLSMLMARARDLMANRASGRNKTRCALRLCIIAHVKPIFIVTAVPVPLDRLLSAAAAAFLHRNSDDITYFHIGLLVWVCVRYRREMTITNCSRGTWHVHARLRTHGFVTYAELENRNTGRQSFCGDERFLAWDGTLLWNELFKSAIRHRKPWSNLILLPYILHAFIFDLFLIVQISQ